MITSTGVSGSSLNSSDWMISNMSLQTQKGEMANRASPPTEEEKQERLWSDVETLAQEAGLDDEEMSSLKSDLISAISTVMEEEDASEMSPELMEKVQASVSETLGQYGIDAADLPTPQGPEGMGPPPGQGGPPPPDSSQPQGTESETSSESLLSMLPYDPTTLQNQSDSAYLLNSWSLLDEQA